MKVEPAQTLRARVPTTGLRCFTFGPPCGEQPCLPVDLFPVDGSRHRRRSLCLLIASERTLRTSCSTVSSSYVSENCSMLPESRRTSPAVKGDFSSISPNGACQSRVDDSKSSLTDQSCPRRIRTTTPTLDQSSRNQLMGLLFPRGILRYAVRQAVMLRKGRHDGLGK